jgi:hypothetical protein
VNVYVLFYRLLYKNFRIKTQKSLTLPVVLYECDSWALTLGEGHRLEGVSEQSAGQNMVGKIKAKLSLCLTKYHAMKNYRGVEVEFHALFTSALDPVALSRDKIPSTHWIGGWSEYTDNFSIPPLTEWPS